MKCREQSRKHLTRSEPRYRQLIGAVILMAVRGCTYRDAVDLISFCAPARYRAETKNRAQDVPYRKKYPENNFHSDRKWCCRYKSSWEGIANRSFYMLLRQCDKNRMVNTKSVSFPKADRGIIPRAKSQFHRLFDGNLYRN